MTDKINVLIFPCGAENAIELHTALKDVVTVNVIGASGRSDHGQFVFKNYIGNVPYITDKSFLNFINDVVDKHNIQVIFPTHDDVALFLAENTNRIKAKIAVAGFDQARICRSKSATYELFKEEDFCPQVFCTGNENIAFPLFAKPDKGQGGKDAFLINENDNRDLTSILNDGYVITEYLPGEEMTVDCFSNRHQELLFAGSRKRNRVFGGISVNSSTVPLTKEIEQIANRINEKLGMKGLWYFQVKKDKHDKFKLMEVSVRAAGTMNLYRGLGVNFPLLTIYDLMGYDVEIIKNDYSLEVDRALFNRYKSDLQYDIIYIDFDDTIIKVDKVNSFVMLFLYNAKNEGKKIRLVTKHEHDLSKTLHDLSIHAGLFEEIIHLRPQDEKYLVIKEREKAIFIDNAYKERVKVRKELNIPVFDVDAISTLINWKE